jgi:hypothetical protein
VKQAARRALLRLCSHAYPRAVRERDGEALIDLAQELVEAGSSPLREAAGLAWGGASARLSGALRLLTGSPWHEARGRLALPLAAALFALAAVGAARAGMAQYWIGWSALVLFVAAAVAVAGAAAGHRWLTATGALAVTGMLGLDALRDVYGAGSRWNSEVGSALVDVLPIWLPAGLLLVACAGAVTRVPAHVGIRRLAWALVPGAALLAIAAEPTRVVIADRVIVFGGFVAAAALVAAAIARRRTDAALPVVAGMVLAAVTPAATWFVAAFLPPPAAGDPPLHLGYYVVAATASGLAVLRLARLGLQARD